MFIWFSCLCILGKFYSLMCSNEYMHRRPEVLGVRRPYEGNYTFLAPSHVLGLPTRCSSLLLRSKILPKKWYRRLHYSACPLSYKHFWTLNFHETCNLTLTSSYISNMYIHYVYLLLLLLPFELIDVVLHGFLLFRCGLISVSTTIVVGFRFQAQMWVMEASYGSFHEFVVPSDMVLNHVIEAP